MVVPIENPADEFLHVPGDRRLWNESYYFDFVSGDVRGFARIGLQPFEDRANLWFYVVRDDGIYWVRDENVPVENCYGLAIETPSFEQRFEVVAPYQEWSISSTGSVNYSKSTRDVFTGDVSRVDVDCDLSFVDPIHEAYSLKADDEAQSHYNQAGRFEGELTLDGSSITVDGAGFRDHSWGGFRDWTPGEWGSYFGALQFDDGGTVMFAVSSRPDGGLRNGHGYRYRGGSAVAIEEVDIYCEDGLSREDRPRGWAEGDLPDHITVSIETDEGAEAIDCVPLGNVPVGYEDRNWELTDPDGPRLKSMLNRIPLRATCETRTGTGWFDCLLPL
jgi:hypothetical protein